MWRRIAARDVIMRAWHPSKERSSNGVSHRSGFFPCEQKCWRIFAHLDDEEARKLAFEESEEEEVEANEVS